MINTLLVSVAVSMLSVWGACLLLSTRWRWLVWGIALIGGCSLTLTLYLTYFLLAGGVKNDRRQLFEGLQYSRHVIEFDAGRAVLHRVVVDLSRYRLVLNADMGADLPRQEGVAGSYRALKTSVALQSTSAVLAMNASFFAPFRDNHLFDYYPREGDWVQPVGYTQIGENIIKRYLADWPVVVVDRDARIHIEESWQALTDMDVEYAFTARSWLVKSGNIPLLEESRPYSRSIFGLSQDRLRAFLVVVDGKQPGYSLGVTLEALAKLLISWGVADAVELDGGGSSSLAFKQEGRAVLLNRPAHTKIPNRERPVANHLLVVPLGK